MLAEAVEAARALDPDVHVIPEFVPGDLYATVRARTEGADLLVLGAGHGECTSVLIGDSFRQRACCPVVPVAADGRVVHGHPHLHATPAALATTP
ncbi:MAG TPA: hypothetical protein VIM17_03965 [Jatrophihabitantaceae bacterium]